MYNKFEICFVQPATTTKQLKEKILQKIIFKKKKEERTSFTLWSS